MTTGTDAVQPQCPREADASGLVAAAGRTPPPSPSGQSSTWSTTTRAPPAEGGGRTTQRGANQEEGWRYSAEGAQDSPGEAGRPTQRVGGGGHHPYAPHKGFVHAGGGAAPSTEEGADLQGFTPAMAHLSLREVYEVSPHHKDGMHLTGGVPDEAIRKVVGRS